MTEARAHKMREYNTSPFARIETQNTYNRDVSPRYDFVQPKATPKVSNTFSSSIFEGMNYPNQFQRTERARTPLVNCRQEVSREPNKTLYLKQEVNKTYEDNVKNQETVKQKCSIEVSHVFQNQNFAEKYKSQTPTRSKENQRPMGFENSYKALPQQKKEQEVQPLLVANAQERYMSQFYNTDSFHTFKEQKETDVDLKKREALEDKIFGRQKQKVTGNLDSSQVQTQMGTNTMKFCNQIQRTKAAVQEQMKQKMMQQVKGQINQIMAQKQKTVQSKDAFKS